MDGAEVLALTRKIVKNPAHQQQIFDTGLLLNRARETYIRNRIVPEELEELLKTSTIPIVFSESANKFLQSETPEETRIAFLELLTTIATGFLAPEDLVMAAPDQVPTLKGTNKIAEAMEPAHNAIVGDSLTFNGDPSDVLNNEISTHSEHDDATDIHASVQEAVAPEEQNGADSYVDLTVVTITNELAVNEGSLPESLATLVPTETDAPQVQLQSDADPDPAEPSATENVSLFRVATEIMEEPMDQTSEAVQFSEPVALSTNTESTDTSTEVAPVNEDVSTPLKITDAPSSSGTFNQITKSCHVDSDQPQLMNMPSDAPLRSSSPHPNALEESTPDPSIVVAPTTSLSNQPSAADSVDEDQLQTTRSTPEENVGRLASTFQCVANVTSPTKVAGAPCALEPLKQTGVILNAESVQTHAESESPDAPPESSNPPSTLTTSSSAVAAATTTMPIHPTPDEHARQNASNASTGVPDYSEILKKITEVLSTMENGGSLDAKIGEMELSIKVPSKCSSRSAKPATQEMGIQTSAPPSSVRGPTPVPDFEQEIQAPRSPARFSPAPSFDYEDQPSRRVSRSRSQSPIRAPRDITRSPSPHLAQALQSFAQKIEALSAKQRELFNERERLIALDNTAGLGAQELRRIAEEYCENAAIYKDAMLEGLPSMSKRLFDVSERGSAPQKGKFINSCDAFTIFKEYQKMKRNFVSRKSLCQWSKLQHEDPQTFIAWKKKALEVDEEQVAQLRMGIIRGVIKPTRAVGQHEANRLKSADADPNQPSTSGGRPSRKRKQVCYATNSGNKSSKN